MPKHYTPTRRELYRASESKRRERDTERRIQRNLKNELRKNGK